MPETITVGAVAYDPKVVAIWEGMRTYFREDARVPVDWCCTPSYEAQVARAPRRADRHRLEHQPRLSPVGARGVRGRAGPLAMRDTDLEWWTEIVVRTGRRDPPAVATSAASGSPSGAATAATRRSSRSTSSPRKGWSRVGDYQSRRFDTDLGKHGDTGTSEVDVLRAVLNGEVDAGAVGSPFWAGVRSGHLVPAGAVESIWSSPHYHHCMFTARVGLAPEDAARFTDALFRMNGLPHLKPILDAEGLKEWVPPHSEGYGSLREAALRQGLLARSG